MPIVGTEKRAVMIIKVLKILCLIIGVIIILLGGIILSAGETGAGVFVLAFAVLFFWLAFLLHKRRPAKAGKMEQLKGKQNSSNKALEFEVRGLDYRLEDFLTLAQENKRYKLSDEEILEKYPSGRVYRYWLNNLRTVELVPEPDNPHDPNAIKVMLEGVHVGYVPRDLCLAVAEKLQQGYMPKVKVRGGPYKYVSDGRVNQSRAEYEITVSLSNA